MKVRIGEKLLSEMRRAELRHGVSYSEIARKALRKTRRLKIRIKRKKAETTYGGEAIRIDIEESEFPGVTPAKSAARLHGICRGSRRLRRRAPSMTAGSLPELIIRLFL